MKKIIIWAFAFCLMFGSVLSVSAVAKNYYTFGSYYLGDDVYLLNNNYYGTVKNCYDNPQWFDSEHIYVYHSIESGSHRLYFTNKPLIQDYSGSVRATDVYVYDFSYDSTYERWDVINIQKRYDTFSLSTANLNWSSDHIYTGSGALYFEGDSNFCPPLPLAEMMVQMVGGELLTVTIPTLGGIVKVLVLCGVGCLALLVALKLFGKRSLIFRN